MSHVTIELSDEERTRLLKEAQARGMELAELIRLLVLQPRTQNAGSRWASAIERAQKDQLTSGGHFATRQEMYGE